MPTRMNTSQARVVDPILTDAATGYVNSEFVGGELFPEVYTNTRGGKRIEFGKESFKLYAADRAPGSAVKRVSYGYAGKDFTLTQAALEGQVPVELLEEASQVPGIDLGQGAVELTMDSLRLSLENEQATLATTAANYDNDHKITLSGTSKWSDAASKPVVQVRTAREAIRSSVGLYPNTMILSPQAFNALAENPSIIERLKYTSQDAVTTALLARLFEVERVVVGKAVKASDADVMSDVWGNFAVLSYVARGGQNPAQRNAARPSFGYTYVLRGNPVVEKTYYDPATRSWVYPTFYERAPLLTGITSGYLFVAPN